MARKATKSKATKKVTKRSRSRSTKKAAPKARKAKAVKKAPAKKVTKRRATAKGPWLKKVHKAKNGATYVKNKRG